MSLLASNVERINEKELPNILQQSFSLIENIARVNTSIEINRMVCKILTRGREIAIPHRKRWLLF